MGYIRGHSIPRNKKLAKSSSLYREFRERCYKQPPGGRPFHLDMGSGRRLPTRSLVEPKKMPHKTKSLPYILT